MVVSKGCVDDKISCHRDMDPKKYIDKNTGTSTTDNKKRRLLNYMKGGCSRLSEVLI